MILQVLNHFKPNISLLKSGWLLLAVLLVLAGSKLPTYALLVIVIILVTTPFFRELFTESAMDERQVFISHYSSHIGYITYLLLIVIALVLTLFGTSIYHNSILAGLLVTPVLIKLIVCIHHGYGDVYGFKSYTAMFLRGIIPGDKIDERQNSLGNYSSHVAFYSFISMVLALFVLDVVELDSGHDNLWYMLLIAPLTTKLIVTFLTNFGAGAGGRMLLYFLATIRIIFIVITHTSSAIYESYPYALVLLLVFLSKRFNKSIGIMLITFGVILGYFLWESFVYDVYYKITMTVFFPVPLILAGISSVKEKG